jgi:hypothetical protein
MSERPQSTTRRFLILMLAIIAQLILVGLLVPSTRPYTIGIGLALVQAVALILFMIFFLLKERAPKKALLLYLPVAIFVGTLEFLILIRWGQRNSTAFGIFIAAIPITLFFPTQIPIELWLTGKKLNSVPGLENEREKLRNRNGV